MPALLAITVLAFASAPVAHAQPDITITTVPIGKPGNLADIVEQKEAYSDGSDGYGYGAVAYDYRIGATEVTNTQYAIFLNAVAQQSDPHGLYNEKMGSDTGAITRSEVDSSYLYTVSEDWTNKPVTWVTFLDAARFCNWLSNGATTDPTSTETGMYTITEDGLFTRNQDYVDANGGWAITSKDEWYKAAYYDLENETYTRWATGDTISTEKANYDNFSDSGPRLKDTNSYDPEQNKTYDMMGNAWEWNEAIVYSDKRFIRGGCVVEAYGDNLSSSRYISVAPSWEDWTIGFRVVQLASVVPEPSTYGILGGAAALLGAVALRRRNRATKRGH